MKRQDDVFEPHATHLRELPFVEALDVRAKEPVIDGIGADGEMIVRAGKRKWPFLVQWKRTHLTRALADGLIAEARRTPARQWLLMAPLVGRPLGRYLVENCVNYVDAAGNCYLALGREHVAWIEGRRPEHRPTGGRGIGAPGYQVMFAILADPNVLNAPIRALAEAAGVGKTAAADLFKRLEREGTLVRGKAGHVTVDRKVLANAWLAGHERHVRPKLLIGRYRAADADPAALERRIEKELEADPDWAWGGGAAAWRLTHHYHGETTVLHHAKPPLDLAKRLRLVPAVSGPVFLMRTPPMGLQGAVPKTAHPWLVYAELLVEGGERARETAEEIRTRFLGDVV